MTFIYCQFIIILRLNVSYNYIVFYYTNVHGKFVNKTSKKTNLYSIQYIHVMITSYNVSKLKRKMFWFY